MGFWQRIISAIAPSGDSAGAGTRRVRAGYDAARPDRINDQHWLGADGLSARAANNPQVRARLRNRCRYERDNNCHAVGIINTHANDLIGSGPRLQILGRSDNEQRAVQTAFGEWAQAVRLPRKLRTMATARAVDGESFTQMFFNRRLDTPVKLDLRLYEADQVATPMLDFDSRHVDGIQLDEFGVPTTYHVLKNHPGDDYGWLAFEKTDVPAADMVHWFHESRPNQYRGIPLIAPALPIFAQLRRYTLSVLAAAEHAANASAVLETEMLAAAGDDEDYSLEEIDLPRGSGMVLPHGYTLKQLDQKFPTTTYREFVRELVTQVARCLLMPYNIAAGTSEGLNYASSRLDQQQYFQALSVIRAEIETDILSRIFEQWFQAAVLVDGFLPQSLRASGVRLKPYWHWDGRGHVDPTKAANARATDLRSGATNLANVYAQDGMDWRDELRQRAEEIKLMRELGIPLDTAGMAPEPANARDTDDE